MKQVWSIRHDMITLKYYENKKKIKKNHDTTSRVFFTNRARMQFLVYQNRFPFFFLENRVSLFSWMNLQ